MSVKKDFFYCLFPSFIELKWGHQWVDWR